MDLKTVFIIWPNGETPDKAYSFTDVEWFDKARVQLDAKGIRYGHALIPMLGDEVTFNYLIKEMCK